jgi:hypothetical protein
LDWALGGLNIKGARSPDRDSAGMDTPPPEALYGFGPRQVAARAPLFGYPRPLISAPAGRFPAPLENTKERGRRYFMNKQWSETGYFRPTVLTYEETADIKLRFGKGETLAQIAVTYGVAAADVRRALRLEDTR